MILIVSASLNSDSNSRILASEAARMLAVRGIDSQWLDLRDHALPFCDGQSAYAHPSVAPVRAMIAQADAIIVATPIYNYDGNAALKNLVELTGAGWEDKVVAFLCAAGGKSSYMSIMGFANSLMLDFRCLIVPRFVYSTSVDFLDGKLVNEEQATRVTELVRATTRLATLSPAD